MHEPALIEELGYLVVDATNLAAWRDFAAHVVGLEALEEDGRVLLLKADGRAFRILVRPGDTDRLHACGWQVRDKAAFGALRERLIAQGVEVSALSGAEAAMRRVTEGFAFTDPSGNRGEIFWGPISDYRRFNSPVGVSRFVMDDLGLGHVVLPAMAFDETQDFWTRIMGFGLSDILHSRRPEGHRAPIHFLHCNSRQHSLALAQIAHPSGCIHFMLELPDIDEVGLAYDRVQDSGTPVLMTLGRHVNDEMISFYTVTPGGFALELGCGGLVRNWSEENMVFETTRGSHWGHRKPAVQGG